MLELRNISKSYTVADFTQVALNDVSVSFRDNEFVAVLGPSGSGKTTMLNIIGGLDHYDSGQLIIDGINTSEYSDRDWDTYRNNRIGFVFQSYNLIPHQTVLANVELALTLTGVSKSERTERALAALAEVGLEEHARKKPSQLSGGQMQRVAIARALINDPEILLADEPTGALDSVTSVQIIDLLTGIAKDRLVIMVTHNPELAQTYATRTVELRDGRISADSHPFDPRSSGDRKAKTSRRASMSFLTAIALSFNNLMTKKGRTLMTAFAGSIGIIGIAAILALANGVNNYIKTIEEDTLSVYPLTIQSQGMDMGALMAASADLEEASSQDPTQNGAQSEQLQSGEVTEIQLLSRIFGTVGSNDLGALKEYLDEDGGGIDKYTNLIQYSYNVTPQIYLQSPGEEPTKVNPDSTFSSLGFASGGLMSSALRTSAFEEMVDDSSLVEQQYDVKAGHWPTSYDEAVLVLAPSGGVSDFVLYSLGLKDSAEKDQMIAQMMSGKPVAVPGEPEEFSYEEILGVQYKVVSSAQYYGYDPTYGVWTDKSSDQALVDSLVPSGESLKVTGIVQPRAGVTATALTPGIYYTPELTERLIETASKTEVVKAQLASPKVNIFTGRTFAEEAEDPGGSDFDMTKLFQLDEEALKNSFKVDQNLLTADLSGLDLTGLNLDPSSLELDASSLPALDLEGIAGELDFGSASLDVEAVLSEVDLSQVDLGINEEEVRALADAMATGYLAFCAAGNDCTDPETSFQAFLKTPEGLELEEQFKVLEEDTSKGLEELEKTLTGQIVEALSHQLEAQLESSFQELQSVLQARISEYAQAVMYMAADQIQGAIAAQLQTEVGGAIETAMSQLAGNLSSAMSVDQEAFMQAFKLNLSEDELASLVTTMMSTQTSSYDGNLAQLGFADLSRPYLIDIYPKDFEGKGEVVKILDGYNQEMEDSGEEGKVIQYTDLVGTLMSSVTDIVNVVSYVLVAFVSISLVVSSIMIGVITYISVLERRKEIGILRSIGASKRDIRTVFNAETLIVGFVAGVMGILVTLMLTVPANAIVNARWGISHVAMLPWQAALILIAVSMGLTFLAGLIPSSAASRKDPVEALRSD